MAKLPKEAAVLKIEAAIENREVPRERRPYLGISNIGNPCKRSMWYGFRWVSLSTLTPRVHRLFSRGHREEPIILADLEAVGVQIKSTQSEITTGHGHIKGHNDGIIANVPDAPKTDHLLEIKTANDANFKKIKKAGVKKTKPEYWAQIQCYMKLEKLTRALLIVVNKNTDERHYERIHYDAKAANNLLKRGVEVISSNEPLAKIGDSTWWECKFCDFRLVCHFDEAPNKNCRTCDSCDLCEEGKWECSLYDGLELTTEQQGQGCGKWNLLQTLK